MKAGRNEHQPPGPHEHSSQAAPCMHPYLNFYFTWSIFVSALPKFGLLPKPNDSTSLSFSKAINLKLAGWGKEPVNFSCRKRCYNLNEKQQADRKKGAGTKLRQSVTFFVPAGWEIVSSVVWCYYHYLFSLVH